MLILGMEGLLPCFALSPLPDSCHTPSLRRQRVGHWRWQYHRRAGTFASPVNILNTYKLLRYIHKCIIKKVTTAIVVNT